MGSASKKKASKTALIGTKLINWLAFVAPIAFIPS
jgi:hypothetical protein